MLVVFPLGLLTTAVVFDAIQVATGNGTFGQVGFWNITAGAIGAVLAAATGLVDWSGIPRDTRAKRIGLIHAGLNSLALVLFVVSWLIRLDRTDHAANAGLLILEIAAIGVASVSAWLGGELVDRLGIGVTPGAHPDAPSSLRTAEIRPRPETGAGRAAGA
jgi:uncharacterized membrane protein